VKSQALHRDLTLDSQAVGEPQAPLDVPPVRMPSFTTAASGVDCIGH
jgi:hypothetical protein